jgi:prephenate dehydratase
MNSLAAFQSNGVNLSSIQSFVDKSSNFNYSFYIEFEGKNRYLAFLTEKVT